VDAGAPGYWNDLPDELAAMGRTFADIRALVLTHAHIDHVGFAELRRQERRDRSDDDEGPRSLTRERDDRLGERSGTGSDDLRGRGADGIVAQRSRRGPRRDGLVEQVQEDLGARVAKLLDLKMTGSFLDKLKKRGTLLDVAKASPRRVSGGAPCQEIVEMASPSLAGLPILQCWPGDGGRYITLPAVFTRDPVSGARNVGMYRLQVFDDRTLGMHWQTHKGGAEHEHRATSRMPVAIALGGDPAMVYAASAPLPPGTNGRARSTPWPSPTTAKR